MKKSEIAVVILCIIILILPVFAYNKLCNRFENSYKEEVFVGEGSIIVGLTEDLSFVDSAEVVAGKIIIDTNSTLLYCPTSKRFMKIKLSNNSLVSYNIE